MTNQTRTDKQKILVGFSQWWAILSKVPTSNKFVTK